MKRAYALLVSFTLVLSLAAPAGAAFDSEVLLAETDTMSEVSASEVELSNEVDEEVETTPSAPEVATPDVVPEENDEFVEPAAKPSSVPNSDTSPLEDTDNHPTQLAQLSISEFQVNGSCEDTSLCLSLGSNVEFIELYNPHEYVISLSGWKLQRQATGATSQPQDFVTFSDVGVFAKEHAIVGLGFHSHDERLVATFTNALNNTAGSLLLINPEGVVVDMVGWGAAAKSFYGQPTSAPGANQSLQRCLIEGQLYESSPRNNVLEFQGYSEVGPTPGQGIECPPPETINACEGIKISEIAANANDQFIELYNDSNHAVTIADCQLQTNRSKTILYFLPDRELEPNDYFVVNIADTALTLTKTTSGTVYLLSSDGLIETDSRSYQNLASNTSWAWFGDNDWRQTHAVTPGSENEYQQYVACADGYWRNEETGRCNKIVEPVVLADCGEGRERNPDTGRCRNIPTARELAPCRSDQYRSEETNRCRNINSGRTLVPCREGQYRSEETNRCRSIAAAASALKPCRDDQFRNLETNRCKLIASTDDLQDCGEGRERNPLTNRCRNVLASSIPVADFPVEPVKQSAQALLGWWALGGIVLLAGAYGAWEWRREITGAFSKVATFFSSKK